MLNRTSLIVLDSIATIRRSEICSLSLCFVHVSDVTDQHVDETHLAHTTTNFYLTFARLDFLPFPSDWECLNAAPFPFIACRWFVSLPSYSDTRFYFAFLYLLFPSIESNRERPRRSDYFERASSPNSSQQIPEQIVEETNIEVIFQFVFENEKLVGDYRFENHGWLKNRDISSSQTANL